jgi:NADPH:quinone reductase-like Zn-dependent oxidoreductase
MKAVRFDEYGGVDVLHVADVPVPEPGQGQVLVEVKAASINPGEAKIRDGSLQAIWPATFPSGEGSDLAGIVTKTRGSRELLPVTRSSASPTSVPVTLSTWSCRRRI